MSAFVVEPAHIDVLVTAALDLPQYGRLQWFWPAFTDEERARSHEAGSPWGPDAVEIAEQHRHRLAEGLDSPSRVGAMLLAENQRSVNFRYDEPDELEPLYVFRRVPGSVNPIVVLAAIGCYEYQACETPDWAASEAHAFIRALEQACIDVLTGPYAGPTHVCEQDRDVFVKYPYRGSFVS